MKLEFVRIPPELREYLPILSTGLNILKATWKFPETPPGKTRKYELRIDDECAADITYFVGHTKKSRAAIIIAALIYAKDSKRRPPAPAEAGPSST
jgi:hypothetical protein